MAGRTPVTILLIIEGNDKLMKEIVNSPLLLGLIIVGILYITAFSLTYFKKAYTHCLELGISKEKLKAVIKSSLFFSIVPSLSIVVGLFVLIPALGTVWSWWRLSVIGSLSYETMISGSVASVGMLSGFFVLIPLGKKLCMSVQKTASASTWKYVLSGVFMLCLFSVYVPVLLIGDTIQALVMITGLIIAVALGILASKPGLKWLNDFIMAFSMIGGMVSSLLWVKLFS